jgi:hypothetical protein
MSRTLSIRPGATMAALAAVCLLALLAASPARAETPAGAVVPAPSQPVMEPAPTPAPPLPDPAPEPEPAVAPEPEPEEPQEPAPLDEPAEPPRAVSTTQTIWQTQVGCISHCSGAAHEQRGTQAATVGHDPAPRGGGGQTVRQTHIGCPRVCAGDDDVDWAELLALVMEELRSAIAEQEAAAGGAMNLEAELQALSVQLAEQLQHALGATAQVQVAEQHQETVQSGGTSQAAVSEQVIRQAQIGCAARCSGTTQEQHASQAAYVVQLGATAAQAVVSQLVWQLQIGCIAYCQETTQVQNASQVIGVVSQRPPERPAPAAQPPAAAAPAPLPGGRPQAPIEAPLRAPEIVQPETPARTAPPRALAGGLVSAGATRRATHQGRAPAVAQLPALRPLSGLRPPRPAIAAAGSPPEAGGHARSRHADASPSRRAPHPRPGPDDAGWLVLLAGLGIVFVAAGGRLLRDAPLLRP